MSKYSDGSTNRSSLHHSLLDIGYSAVHFSWQPIFLPPNISAKNERQKDDGQKDLFCFGLAA